MKYFFSKKIKRGARTLFGYMLHVTCSRSSGLSIVEIIIVIAVIFASFTGLLQLSTLEARTQNLARQEAKAYILAREVLEAVRFVRDEGWDTFAALSFDTVYYPVISGSRWTLSVSDPGLIDGYARWAEFHEVFRDDSTDDIDPAGLPDSDTRHAEISVSWTAQGGATRTITVETYLTNWQEQ